MKVVWVPIPVLQDPPPRFRNVWYKPNEDRVWMDLTPYDPIEHALQDKEEEHYKRIAILQF